jgi:neutral ceramidase
MRDRWTVRVVITALVAWLSLLADSPTGAPVANPVQGAVRAAWQAGVAKIVVTPREPIFQKGYGARTKPSEGVRADLYVKALAIRDETGATSVLITSDLHSWTRGMSETVAEAARRQYGLPRERVLFNGSHTHSGPAITGEPVFRPSEDINPEQQGVIRRYTAQLLTDVTALIGQAIGNLAPAELSYGLGSAGFGVNRRRVTDATRHLPGPVDHDVPVLRVRAADGTLRAVVFGYACHATSATTDYVIHGDWPGYAQAAIEAANPGTIAMFVTGCGADCNPLPRGTPEAPEVYGAVMGEAVRQALGRQMRALSGPLTAAFEHVDIPFQTPPTRDELQTRLKTQKGMAARHARQLLDELERDGRIADRYPYPVQVWQLGSGLTLIALGGVVVVDYSLRFKQEYGWNDTWVAGYSNDVMGYIPSRRVLEEGGYEAGGAMVNYGRPGPVTAAIEDTIAGKVEELVRRVGGR